MGRTGRRTAVRRIQIVSRPKHENNRLDRRERIRRLGHSEGSVVPGPASDGYRAPTGKHRTAEPESRNADGRRSRPTTLREAVRNHDAVISAYNPGWNNPDIYEQTLSVYPRIVEAVKLAGIKRLLVVGGAGSLYVGPGMRLLDSGRIPERLLPGVKALAEVYETVLKPENELDWVFLSPAAELVPGKRTGKFRIGKDELIRDASGKSSISVEDYAAAMIDELEKPVHHRERFTIGY